MTNQIILLALAFIAVTNCFPLETTNKDDDLMVRLLETAADEDLFKIHDDKEYTTISCETTIVDLIVDNTEASVKNVNESVSIVEEQSVDVVESKVEEQSVDVVESKVAEVTSVQDITVAIKEEEATEQGILAAEQQTAKGTEAPVVIRVIKVIKDCSESSEESSDGDSSDYHFHSHYDY